MLIIGILPIFIKPIQFGRDFVGGTSIVMQLERALDPAEVVSTVDSLQRRINAFGLKDMSVRPLGNQYVSIDIAATDPRTISQLQDLLTRQGRFEGLFDGKPVLLGSDIVDVYTTVQQGFSVYQTSGGWSWTVPFLVSAKGSQMFADAVNGRCTPITNDRCAEVIYMFIDRPENAVLLVNTTLFAEESAIPVDLSRSDQTIPLLEILSNSGVELLISDSLDNVTLSRLANKTVIVPTGSFDISILNMTAAKVIQKQPITADSTGNKFWTVTAIGLENIVHLTPDVTSGRPFSNPTITGGSETQADALAEANKVAILLKSGRLPVSLSVSDVSSSSATLGRSFLKSAFFSGIGAGIVVTCIVFLRYRKIRIAAPIMFTAASEVLMIVGLAAWIGWEIDLAAVAGIVAAVGTGVDHQVIISDEVLRRERELELSISGRIRKAFSIIFMSAATVIFAMFPLLVMGLGALKGFAIITILGSLIGVFIARPAFAEIINYLLRHEKPKEPKQEKPKRTEPTHEQPKQPAQPPAQPSQSQ